MAELSKLGTQKKGFDSTAKTSSLLKDSRPAGEESTREAHPVGKSTDVRLDQTALLSSFESGWVCPDPLRWIRCGTTHADIFAGREGVNVC